MIKNEARKLLNWRASWPDKGQAYLLRNVTSPHDKIARRMSNRIYNNKNIPGWPNKGRTDLQKDNIVDNFRPISCLPLM